MWANLGLMEHEGGDYAQAMKSFERAIHLKPSLYVPNLFLGIDSLHEGNSSAAIPSLVKAERINKTDPEAPLELGRAYSSAGNFPAAAKEFARAAELDPRQSDAWLGEGLVVHRIDEPGFAKRFATHAEIHNVYGMQNARATFEGLKQLDPDQRPMVLTRAAYAGGQRYGETWTGDNSSTWNHLRLTTPMLKNLGLSGFAFSGADVGGFAGTASPELLTKWLQVAAFQPFDRDHTEKGTGDQEPWIGGPEQEAIRRRYIEERYRLMPYIYQLADESSRTGLPMLRPLFLDFPNATPDGHPIDVDPAAAAEFMLGPDLLIASSPYPDEPDTYTVEFPSVGWYNYWNGAKLTQSSIQVQPDLATLPVFVRAGSILPLEPLVQSTSETPNGPLTVRVYAGDACSGDLYLDDGKSYAFERGGFLRMHFTCKVTPESLTLSIGEHEGPYPAWWKQIRTEIIGWSPRQSKIQLNSKSVDLRTEKLTEGFAIDLDDDGKGMQLQLQ
jgi:alpha-glucosidase